MPGDVQFIDSVINAHQTIPAPYPTLSGVAVGPVIVGYVGSTVTDVLPDGSAAFFVFTYPLSDNLFVHAAVGYQLQILRGSVTGSAVQLDAPAGIVFQTISDFQGNPSPTNYIDLTSGNNGRFDMPAGVLIPGNHYTVRVRSLVFSEKGLGTVSNQYFKYTEWGSQTFRVNSVPSSIGLNVNGVVNPTRLLSTSSVSFSFTFSDTDGPQYLYRVQVGTIPGIGFVPNVWDSGLISAGSASGPMDFTVAYSGPALSQGVNYFWRVNVQDGLSDGGFSSGNDSFRINSPLALTSIKVDGIESLTTLVSSPPTVANAGVVISWTGADADGDPQTAYAIRVVQSSPDSTTEILIPQAFSGASNYSLPTLAPNSQVSVFIKLRDNTEFGPEAQGEFFVNSIPVATNFLVDGKTNPGDVGTSSPTFSWQFSDDSPLDAQQAFRIQVATADDFATLLWDSGDVASASSFAIYGSTPAPLVAPVVLTHGQYYYARVKVYDGISHSGYANSFFAVNTRPGSPMLLTPTSGAYSGTISVTWANASPLDVDLDPVTYSIEITPTRSTNSGWTFLAGPFASGVTSYALDSSVIPAGNDYGVRVVANDGFADSDPTSGTSPVNAVGLGFTILNHAPVTPTLILPSSGQVASSSLRVEWLESSVVDVDGDVVFYLLEITRDSTAPTPVFENVGVFPAGTSVAIIDVSQYPDGSLYKMRLTAKDSKGANGAAVLSSVFSIINTTAINDFENFGGSVYLAASDGRLMRGAEAIWQVDENWSSDVRSSLFEVFSSGSPVVSTKDGALVISSPSGSTYILRQGGE